MTILRVLGVRIVTAHAETHNKGAINYDVVSGGEEAPSDVASSEPGEPLTVCDETQSGGDDPVAPSSMLHAAAILRIIDLHSRDFFVLLRRGLIIRSVLQCI